MTAFNPMYINPNLGSSIRSHKYNEYPICSGEVVEKLVVVTYLMQAYDPDNFRLCFWLETDPTATPSDTLPSSIVANLTNKAIVHTV